jgi:hypothetical protein
MEIDGLLGASTEELTRVANNLIEVLTPMGVGVVAGMLLCGVARAAPTESEGFDIIDKIVGSARALYRHRQEEDKENADCGRNGSPSASGSRRRQT